MRYLVDLAICITRLCADVADGIEGQKSCQDARTDQHARTRDYTDWGSNGSRFTVYLFGCSPSPWAILGYSFRHRNHIKAHTVVYEGSRIHRKHAYRPRTGPEYSHNGIRSIRIPLLKYSNVISTCLHIRQSTQYFCSITSRKYTYFESTFRVILLKIGNYI